MRWIDTICGFKDAKLNQFGLPVHPAFWQDVRYKRVILSILRLELDLPIVLIVGVYYGVGGVKRISMSPVRSLSDHHRPRGSQIVVVCGKSSHLWDDIEAADWPIPVFFTGFVDKMSELMYASEIIISNLDPVPFPKPGSEA